jgi:hypothetical protein
MPQQIIQLSIDPEQCIQLSAVPKDPSAIDPTVLDANGNPLAYDHPRVDARIDWQLHSGDDTYTVAFQVVDGQPVIIGAPLHYAIDARAVQQGMIVRPAMDIALTNDIPDVANKE